MRVAIALSAVALVAIGGWVWAGNRPDPFVEPVVVMDPTPDDGMRLSVGTVVLEGGAIDRRIESVTLDQSTGNIELEAIEGVPTLLPKDGLYYVAPGFPPPGYEDVTRVPAVGATVKAGESLQLLLKIRLTTEQPGAINGIVVAFDDGSTERFAHGFVVCPSTEMQGTQTCALDQLQSLLES